MMNAVMLFSFCVALLFCMGDYETVTASPLPILEVYYQATKSKTAASVLVVLTACISAIALFNILASVSRLTWAFARDKGLPFSDTFSYVSTRLKPSKHFAIGIADSLTGPP